MRIDRTRDTYVQLQARDPLLLDVGTGCWRVARGQADLFVATLDADGRPGRRWFLLRLETGERFCGVPETPGAQLLVVGGLDCELVADDADDADWWQRLAEVLRVRPAEVGQPADWLPDAVAHFLRRQHDSAQQQTKRRRQLAHGQQAEGVEALAATLQPDVRMAAADDPQWDALCEVARAQGVELAEAAASAAGTGRERVRSVLSLSDLRWRTVLLRGAWWQDDQGPLLAWAEDDDRPVALLPRAGGGYQLFDPSQGLTRSVTAEQAPALQAEALMIYPTLAPAPQGLRGLVALAVHGARGDAARIALVGLLGAVMAAVTPVASGILVDQVLPSGDRGRLFMLAMLLLGVTLGTVSFGLVRAFARLRLEARADVRVQTALFDRVLRLPLAALSPYPVGDLADRLLGMQRVREQLSGAALSALLSTVFSAVSLVVLFFYSWQLALVALLLVLVYALVVTALIVRQLRFERAQAEARGEVQGFNTQMLIGVAKLRIAHAEGRAFGAWARRFAEQKRQSLAAGQVANKLALFQAGFGPFTTIVIMAGIVMQAEGLQLFAGGQPAAEPGAMAGGLSVGAFVAFNAAFGQFLSSARQGVEALSAGLSAVPQLERAQPLLRATATSRRALRDPGTIAGAVQLHEVSFRYATDGPLVLDRLSFSIEPGEFVALVGASGSGKSTVQRLLMGLEQPQSGEVRIDGQSLVGLDLAQVRRQMGIVLQQNTLPGGPLHEVILGEAGGTLEAAWDAARAAGLAADIEAMPMGMHTVLMDGATTLSGGQRQRLAIARALAREPRMLLLDEATSALDNRAQAAVSETLAKLPVTRILVAHRLSTIRQADRILVLEQGRLVEAGHFEALLAQNGPFARLARRQLA